MPETHGASTPAPAFDAAAFAVAEDADTEFEVYDPRTKGGTGIFITVYSKDSEKARAILRSQINRRFKSSARRNSPIALTAEELDAESLEVLAGCTKAWRGMLWKGDALACTPENARFVYSQAPAIREQVEDAMNDRALFTRR